MSCNGCRVLRKGCSETCILRPCLQWIETADAQAHATLFVAKFFGRADLMSFIAAVPSHQRPAVFQSLLFEACGRTINPVNGAVGLLTTGNWHICQSAVETVLRGGILQPIPPELLARALNAPPPRTANSDTTYALPVTVGPATTRSQPSDVTDYMQEAEGRETTSFGSEICSFENWAENDRDAAIVGQNCRKLLDLFV